MRNRFRRKINFDFNETFYKPRGIQLNQLKTTVISDDELETIRLRYIEKLDQDEAAEKMGISQSQYQRDITSALEKITRALINGEAINIKKTNQAKI